MWLRAGLRLLREGRQARKGDADTQVRSSSPRSKGKTKPREGGQSCRSDGGSAKGVQTRLTPTARHSGPSARFPHPKCCHGNSPIPGRACSPKVPGLLLQQRSLTAWGRDPHFPHTLPPERPYHVPGPQDDGPGADMTTAAAPGAVEPVAAAPLESHGHHGERLAGFAAGPVPGEGFPRSGGTRTVESRVSGAKQRVPQPAPTPGPHSSAAPAH